MPSGIRETMHALTSEDGAQFAGRIWSPGKGTAADEFVGVAAQLSAFAQSAPAERDGAKRRLLADARRLWARLDGDSR